MNTNINLKDKINLVLNHLIGLENQSFDDDVNPLEGFFARDFGIKPWDWPQGVALYSMNYFQELKCEDIYDEFFNNWIVDNIESGLPSANINTTAPYLMLISLAPRTNNTEYLKMCEERAEFLMNELPKTQEGGFQHTTSGSYDKNDVILNEEQLWADTFFMSILFLAKAGKVFKRTDWSEEAIYQILIHLKYLQDPRTGLLNHGWSFERMDNFGAIKWCRGNCWFTFGILQILDELEGVISESTKRFVLNAFIAQVKTIASIVGENGLWHTVLLNADSYEESSGSAGFIAGIFQGIRKGILSKEYLPLAETSLLALINNIKDNGEVANVSAGTAMGMDELHYNNIITAPMPYGQSLTAIALIEANAYYQSVL